MGGASQNEARTPPGNGFPLPTAFQGHHVDTNPKRTITKTGQDGTAIPAISFSPCSEQTCKGYPLRKTKHTSFLSKVGCSHVTKDSP